MSRRIIPIAAAALLAMAAGSCKSTEVGGPELPTADPALRSADYGHAADPLVPPPVVSVYFAASDVDIEAGNFVTQFSVFETREILAVAFWEPRPGTHVQRIEYYTPDGARYESVEIPFTTETQHRPAYIELPGHVGKVVVRWLPQSGDVGVRVVDRLPVSGTPIRSNVVIGTWSARLYYDEQGPLVTASFEVQP